jgi:hypothetical protein
MTKPNGEHQRPARHNLALLLLLLLAQQQTRKSPSKIPLGLLQQSLWQV